MTFKSISLIVLIALIILAFLYLPNALRVYKIINLHEKDSIAYNYINMQKFTVVLYFVVLCRVQKFFEFGFESNLSF